MTMFPRLLLVTIFLLLIGTAAFANERDELTGIKRQIKEKQQLLKKTKKVENKVSSELVSIEKSLQEKETNLMHLNSELKTVESGIAGTSKQIQQTVAELEVKKAEIARRVSSLYKAGEMGTVRMFFSSGSIPQAIENQRFMQAVIENDKKLFSDYQDKLLQLKALKESLENDAARKEKLSARIKAKKLEIETEKSKKTEILTRVRQDKKVYQSSIKELQANAVRLQSMIERLEARSRKGYTSKIEAKKLESGGHHFQPPVTDKGFGAQRGRLPLPTSGTITSRFGKHKHAEFNSYTFNNGITIAAPMNAVIKAVFEGNVIFADKFKGYGNMLIIDHGGGFYTLYAHADRIVRRVGAKVQKNEVIGYVGDTDSTDGAKLYFEIRYQGKPIDPGPWLQ